MSSLPTSGWTSPSGLKYHVSAVDPQILRIRIGAGALPEDASWAVLQDARVPLTCAPAPGQSASTQILMTAALKIAVDAQSGLVTVSDSMGAQLWQDAAAPTFKPDGSFTFTGVIPFGSHFYGLGDKPDSIDKFGKSFINWNKDVYRFTAAANNLYRSIPFFIRKTGNTYTGYFLDNTWQASFDFGQTQSDTLALTANGGGIDYYIIAGASPKEVISNYAKLTGSPPLPALWAFGWQQSKYSYNSATEASDIAKTYRRMNIPADVIWLDIDFQHDYIPFTIGASYSPIDAFIKSMKEIDFKTILIADLHIAQVTSDPTKTTDQSGVYLPYTQGQANNYFVRDKHGNEFADKVWPSQANDGNGPKSVFPDFIQTAVRDWWGSLLQRFYVGDDAAGIWNDMNEPAILNPASETMPLDNIHHIEEPGFIARQTTHAEVHNIFGMQNSRATHDGLLTLKPDQRPFVMTRSSFAGGQRYAVTWTGDNLARWEHLRIATNQIAGLGLGGFHAAADIGGYHGTPTSSLLTRWIQIGAFYPISRDHAEIDKPPQEPWENGTQADIDTRIKYIRNRYALMPYIYTIAEEAARTGVPMLRRMFLEFPDATAPGDTTMPIDIVAETQFMFGPDVLVAPSPIEQGLLPAPPYVYAIQYGLRGEAENAALSGRAVMNNDLRGYTGGGFVDLAEHTGAQMSFNLSGIPAAGSYSLQIRYAKSALVDDQDIVPTLSVIVDGSPAGQMSFPAVADRNAWANTALNLSLSAGDHTIVLVRTAKDSGSVNIDSMAITAAAAPYPSTPAPAVSREQHNIDAPYDVLLPPGLWYDYWTGALVPAPASGTASSWVHHIANPTIADIPVFVRAGAIVPKMPPETLASIQSTADVAQAKTLQLDVYPGDNGSGSIYIDAGDGFAYQSGAYYRRAFTCSVSGNEVTVNFGAVEGSYKPSWTNVRVTVAGAQTGAQTVAESAAASSVTLSISPRSD